MDKLTIHTNPSSGLANTAKPLSLSSPAEFNSSFLHEQIFNQQTLISITNQQSPCKNLQYHLFVPPSFRGTNTTILRNQSLIPLFHHNPFPLFPYYLIP
jgi:hypothetical protein